MSYIDVLQGTATWLPFIATDVNTGLPRTGITFGQVTVIYKKSGDLSFTAKSLLTTDFHEIGNGLYEILFSTLELSTLGTFFYMVNGGLSLPAPAIRQFVGQAVIQSSATYTAGGITLSTNILTGNLIDLSGNPMENESVQARVISSPTIIGTSPNIGGLGTDIISTVTDSVGFFALEVVQGSIVDIIIPSVNFRRTLTVPANATDSLFMLP
jgi:hypothetical protein